ncbi:MAG TPA: phytanoyl-CoA dioxygenase family protein [Thermoanaerobaculia bacterium]|nr:phytanoyl-CoA dioxygenase family protein [Thermoanaerobaculia bacterium]
MTEQAVLTHGVADRAPDGGAVGLHVEELRLEGFTLVPSGLRADELEALRAKLEDVYARQCAELDGEDSLARCQDLDVARAPLVYDDAFLSVAANSNLLAVVERMLGTNFVLMQQNGLLTRPATANYQVRWHRDLSYQHWVSSEPLAINALLTLDEFTFESGATFVLPASHHRPEFPSDEYVRRHERVLAAPAGTFLVLDGMLFHRAGRNISGRPRRAVNHLIGRPFLGQQFDFAAMLGDRYAGDALLSRYLGYRWRPQPDVISWRAQRMTV